jgi:hypothetical protein
VTTWTPATIDDEDYTLDSGTIEKTVSIGSLTETGYSSYSCPYNAYSFDTSVSPSSAAIVTSITGDGTSGAFTMAAIAGHPTNTDAAFVDTAYALSIKAVSPKGNALTTELSFTITLKDPCKPQSATDTYVATPRSGDEYV